MMATEPVYAKDYAYQAEERPWLAKHLMELYGVDHVSKIEEPLIQFKRVVDEGEQRVVQLELTWPHESLADWDATIAKERDASTPEGILATVGEHARLLKTGGIARDQVACELSRADGGVFLSAITVRQLYNPTAGTLGLDTNAVPITEENRYIRSIGRLMHIEPRTDKDTMSYSLLRAASGFVNDHRLVNTYGSTRPEQLWNGILRLPGREGFETRWCLVPRGHVLYVAIACTPAWRDACSPLVLSKANVEADPTFLLAPEPLIEMCIEQAAQSYYPKMYRPVLNTLYFSLNPFGATQFCRPAEWTEQQCVTKAEQPVRMVIQLAYTVFPEALPQSDEVVCTFERTHGRTLNARQHEKISATMT